MYTDKEYLQAALESGMIDLTTLQCQMEMAEKNKYLKEHEYRIWQGKEGRWYTYLPKNGKRRLVGKKDKETIENAIVAFYREKDANPTIEELFHLWVNEKIDMHEIRKGTYDKYCNDFNHWCDSIKHYKIKGIDEDMLETFIRYVIGNYELTVKSYGNLRTVIIGIFKYAKRKKFTSISISTFFRDLQISRKIFKQSPRDQRKEVFSDEETEIIIKYLRDNPTLIRLGILLCFQTGIRIGELIALKFSDVEDGMLHIQRQEVKEKDENNKTIVKVVEYTKTEAGNRFIILTENAMRTIEMLKNYSHAEYIMQRDKRIRCSTINHELYRICSRCNIVPKSMHKIRKTYGTILIDSGVDDSIIMEQMGHSDITTTRKYYYYGRNNQIKKRQQIESAIGVI